MIRQQTVRSLIFSGIATVAVLSWARTNYAQQSSTAASNPGELTLDRIFSELPDVPLRDHVWPKFLRENAMRVFRLDR